MGTYRIAAVLFLLLAIPQTGRAGGPDAGARQLVQTVDAALAGAAQAARQGLDPRSAKYAPFWNALQAMQARVSRIEGTLSRPGNEFFLLVDQGSSDLGELRVAWARTGAQNGRIAEQLRIASTSYRLLRSTWGREGLRQRQGGLLNEAERAQFQRLQQAERRLAARLQRLRDQARRRRDAATAAEMERFRAEAEHVAQASADLTSYLNALIAASEMRGEWQANTPYVRKTAPPAELAAAEETVQNLYVDSDIGQVFTVDLGKAAEGVSGQPATKAAVQILQSGEETTESVVVEPIPDSEEEDAVEPAEDESAMVEEPAVESPETEETEEAGAPEAADEVPAAIVEVEDKAEAPDEIEIKKSAPPAATPAPIPPPIG